MATYLELVNQVMDNLRWNPISAAEFATPPDPAPAVKRFINQGKDEVLTRLGTGLIEKELSFETNPALTYANTANQALETSVLIGTQYIISLSAVFDSDWMVGAKLMCPDVVWEQSFQPAEDNDANPTWVRIVERPASDVIRVDHKFSELATAAITNWTLWKDEYNLDATVRQILSMWTNRGPLALEFAKNVDEFERYFPGSTTFGTPQRAAILRSETSGYFWRVKLYPAPEDREIIRYRAKTRMADLSAATDSWTIEPELEAMIVDAATMRALKTPIQNDPDLALVLDQDIARRVSEYRAEHEPADPKRRRRRQEPDGAPPTSRYIGRVQA